MPRNGPYVLGGLANHGGELEGLIHDLSISKQAASQLVDVLVVRGYLDRHINPEDRRRLIIQLTDRGRAAAQAVRCGVEDVDARLANRLTADELEHMCIGLATLAEIRDEIKRDG